MKRCEILSQVLSRELIDCPRIKILSAFITALSNKDTLLLSAIINALMLITI